MEKILKTANRAAKISAAILLAFSILIGSYNIIIPDSVSCMTGEMPNDYGAATAIFTDTVAAFQNENGTATTTAQYRLFGLIPVKTVTVSVYEKPYYYVGGMPFGVKFSVDGLFVSGYGDEVEKSQNPGYAAGIRPSDVITKVDGKDIFGTIFFAEAIDAKKGAPVTLTYERDGKEYTAEVTPYLSSDGRYKTGLLIRDSGAGIGIVTYIDPESKSFGGLGHGICDGETGALIPVLRGFVSEVTISGAVVGTPGSPGELKGSFDDDKNGALTENTNCGVFGMLTELPKNHGELVQIATRSEVKNGDAYIISTLDESGPQKFSVKISDINRNATGNKCFSVKVTDQKLIEKSGGIVQGMSGSPIIQNGRLIGAVTHVLVNDPTEGYGIFIENMISSMPEFLR